jgi:ArsR family transcriptional regulator, arsenate/arsenite/antimonite-responsive transcriptional repressor
MGSRRMTAEERAKVFKALSDPRRVEIVDLLRDGRSLCGTQLAESLGISLALVCHHWEVLVDAGVLKKERVGQLRICTVDVERVRRATGEWHEPAKPRPRKRARR